MAPKTISSKKDKKKDSKTPSQVYTKKKQVEKEEIKEEAVQDEEDNELDEEDDDFFNQNSYDTFTTKYGIQKLSHNYYTNNDIHKEDVVVPIEDRITSEIMTHAEYTRVISERAKQIENGSNIFITLKNEHDPIKIAEKEIKQKRCPLKIIRYLTKNIKEEWSVNEMIIPFGINL